jgi:hypothetical protein
MGVGGVAETIDEQFAALREQMASMEQRLEGLTRENAVLRRGSQAETVGNGDLAGSDREGGVGARPLNRRGLLTAAAGAAGGMLVAGMAGPASANPGDNLIIGVTTNDASSSQTSLTSSSSSGLVPSTLTVTNSGSGTGVLGIGGTSTAGLLGVGGGSSGDGVLGRGGSPNGDGVTGIGLGTGSGVVGTGGPTEGTGVHGIAAVDGVGVLGEAHIDSTGTEAAGVKGFAPINGVGVYGQGLLRGVHGVADTGHGVLAQTTSTGAALRAEGSGNGASAIEATTSSDVLFPAVISTSGAADQPAVQANGATANAMALDVHGTSVLATGAAAATPAVKVTSGTASKAAVQAWGLGAATGLALEVKGRATFNRSGLLNIPAGASNATTAAVTGGLTANSRVLATLQTNAGAVQVKSAVPNTTGANANKITVNLSAAAPAGGVKVAWFVFG